MKKRILLKSFLFPVAGFFVPLGIHAILYKYIDGNSRSISDIIGDIRLIIYALSFLITFIYQYNYYKKGILPGKYFILSLLIVVLVLLNPFGIMYTFSCFYQNDPL